MTQRRSSRDIGTKSSEKSPAVKASTARSPVSETSTVKSPVVKALTAKSKDVETSKLAGNTATVIV